ncbi:hypothetical protein P8452_18003 [Trifolium repens]|nr:hypothetical protein P8452_18003 [Trifolium repens]
MTDGWTDTKGRTLINFLVNSPAGTMFVKSVDASAYMKIGQKVYELLDSFVEEVGESNVVQLVTDNGSNYVLAGKHLQVSRPKIFWTPCAAHCLDLMLEDIGKIPRVSKVVKKGISLVGFIYNHSLVLNLMREKLESELVRNGVTRMGVGHFGLKEAIRQRATIAAAEWWKRYGAKTPNLQLLAIKILSLTCSPSGCERNWSAFEHIHSKKRNRLEHQKLQDLVFIKYNQTLKERYDSNDVIDPVIMDDDIDGNEWLLGDEVEAQAQSDLVFDGDDLSWLDVDLASGAAEPTINTRSQARTATTPAPTPAPRPPLHPTSSSRTKKSRKKDEFDDLDYVGDEEDEVHEEESSGEGSDDEETMNFNDS